MTDNQPPPPAEEAKPGEISLEDIDRLLETEDPEFTKSLEEVRAVEVPQDIVIDAAAIDESLTGDPELEDRAAPRKPPLWTRFKTAVRIRIASARLRMRTWLTGQIKATLVFARTRPKEFLFYSFKLLKAGAKKLVIPLAAFQRASRLQRWAALVLLCMGAGSAWVLEHNFRGIWLPSINEPLLRSFEPLADSTETYQRQDAGESFYSAFPQERYEFLFPKMKVNLRRTSENPNPMGAFEIIVQMDSKDTAIEARDRETEFFDMLERVFEDETFNDLESELGKSRLKSRLKRELNQKLTQGWVKDISFKTFILKP